MSRPDPKALERAREFEAFVERDGFGILRFRTPSTSIATEIAEIMSDGGYGVVVTLPRDTWHGKYAVSCWGDYMLTSSGPVPIPD